MSVLVVDNNLGDHQLIQLSLEEAGIACPVEAAMDGYEGKRRLESAISAGEMYQLVMVDLNMPRMDGRELLKWARAQSALKEVPMVVLTSSHAPQERMECMAIGASDFFTKPSDYSGYLAIVASLRAYLR